MLIGRVIGDAVASAKHADHEGLKLLLVEPLDLDGEPTGATFVAIDPADAGPGDRVLLATDGFSAMSAIGRIPSPSDVAIMGVIDRLDIY